MHRPLGISSGIELDLCEIGIVVVDQDRQVVSANDRVRDLLRAKSLDVLVDRVEELQHELDASAADGEVTLEIDGLGPLLVRSCAVTGAGGTGRVLLLRDARSLAGANGLLQQASRYRAAAFLSRDWVHELKGMLSVIRINAALLGRLLEREPVVVDAPVTRCLDAIPREVERLDAAIEVMLDNRAAAASRFDLTRTCERLKTLIAPRALRQQVEVVWEVKTGSMEIRGHEDQVQAALLNILVNSIEAMPEHGRLAIRVEGDGACVSVSVCDSGTGLALQPDDRQWRPHFVSDPRQTGIGLHVARTIVESHGGRIGSRPNVPRGTCTEITFPAANGLNRTT